MTGTPPRSPTLAPQNWLDPRHARRWVDLAAQQGTPYYLFDADRVCARIQAVRDAFDQQVQVYYAVKANPNLGLLRAVRETADGLDISSGGELAQALLAGHEAQRMSFAGPAKTEAELQAAIQAGVGAISAESLREVEVCAAIARRLERPANLLLRVNPALNNRGYGLKMGGRPVQFGIDEEALPHALQQLQQHAPWLNCVGLHAYIGSQCFDAASVAEATDNALRIAVQLQAAAGAPLRKVNLGGGFGVAQAGDGRELDVQALAALLQPVLGERLAQLPGCTLLFELGRYLLADAGLYVVQVVDRKVSRGRTFITCDGGLNHQLAAAGTFGAALRGNFPMLNLSRPDAPALTCHIAGPSCNPTDLLGVDTTVADPQPGDLLGVAMSGAYGLTASPLLFLGRDTPTEWVLQRDATTIGRRSRPMTDFN